jgi:hypothetical protein
MDAEMFRNVHEYLFRPFDFAQGRLHSAAASRLRQSGSFNLSWLPTGWGSGLGLRRYGEAAAVDGFEDLVAATSQQG